MFDDYIESNHHFLETLTVEAFNRRIIPKYLNHLQVTDASGTTNRITELQENLNELRTIIPHHSVNVRTSITPDEIKNITIYFTQGYQYRKSALASNLVIAPLLDYYSFMQFMKGYLSILFDSAEDYFRGHGISSTKDANTLAKISRYADSKTLFPLIATGFGIKDDFKRMRDDADFPASTLLENFAGIKQAKQYAYITYCFENLHMLSSLVRYHPASWVDIMAGISHERINDIRDFRQFVYEKALNMLYKHFFQFTTRHISASFH